MEIRNSASDSPHVIAPPPSVYIGGLLVGFLLHRIYHLDFLQSDFLVPISITLIIVSVVVFIMSVGYFAKARTNVDVSKPTTSIVAKGPYRFSRNPIYLSMTILYLGITTWVNDLWLLIMLVPVLLIIQHGVIKREEFYLRGKFGEAYDQYKESVRRWL